MFLLLLKTVLFLATLLLNFLTILLAVLEPLLTDLDRIILLPLRTTLIILQVRVMETLVLWFLLRSNMLLYPFIPMNANDSLYLSLLISRDPIRANIFFTLPESFLAHSSLHPTAMIDPLGALLKSLSN